MSKGFSLRDYTEEPLTERERMLARRLLSDPLGFPKPFQTWLQNSIQVGSDQTLAQQAYDLATNIAALDPDTVALLTATVPVSNLQPGSLAINRSDVPAGAVVIYISDATEFAFPNFLNNVYAGYRLRVRMTGVTSHGDLDTAAVSVGPTLGSEVGDRNIADALPDYPYDVLGTWPWQDDTAAAGAAGSATWYGLVKLSNDHGFSDSTFTGTLQWEWFYYGDGTGYVHDTGLILPEGSTDEYPLLWDSTTAKWVEQRITNASVSPTAAIAYSKLNLATSIVNADVAAAAAIAYTKLGQIPFCDLTHNANQSVNDSTWTKMTWNTETSDRATMHDTGTNPERITVPTAGVYYIHTNIVFDANASGNRAIRVLLNGNVIEEYQDDATGGGKDTHLVIDVPRLLAANDYIEVEAWQDSGGALDVLTSTNEPHFAVIWQGA